MSFLNTWSGVAAMFIFAAAVFAYDFWSEAARRKEVDRGKGLEVSHLGRGLVVAGMLVGGSGLLFGEVPPGVPWRDIAGASLLGAAAGVVLMKRATAKWDTALRKSEGLQPHIVTWWESQWVILGALVALLLFSLVCPAAVASIADALGNFGATSGYLIAGFFLSFGLLVRLWAKRRARQYGEPITLPMVRR